MKGPFGLKALIRSIPLLAAAISLAAAPAIAATCGGHPALDQQQIRKALEGMTVCVGAAGLWESQEFHKPNGDVIDWKRGPLDSSDPTAKVGVWAVLSLGRDAAVSYRYGAEESSFAVAVANSLAYFCPPGSDHVEVTARLIAGQHACGS